MVPQSHRDTGIAQNWKCILICLTMSLANFQYGYDTATIGGFQAMPGFLAVYGFHDPKAKIGWNIDTTVQQLITSFLNIGTIIGVILTHLWGKKFGRRYGVWMASMISFGAAGIQIGTEKLVGLYFGRILIGISNGFFITFANVYVAEVSPAHLRGPLVSLFGVWVSIGSIIGATVNNATKDFTSKHAYQIPLATLYAIPFLLSILIIFLPESPRWLLVQGRDEQAKRSLIELRGKSFKGQEELLEEEFLEMQRGIAEELEKCEGSAFKDMFKGTELRRTLICFGVILSHSSSGIWLIIGYGTFFFQQAGVNRPFLATIMKSFMGLMGVFLSIFLNYRLIGRRFSMLLGHAGSTIFMLGMGIAASIPGDPAASGRAILGCALIWYFVYNGFSGAELNWGAKVAYIWAASNAITFVFLYFFLPEMRGRSLEEIDEMFQNRVPTWEFPAYHCISADRAREQALKNTAEEAEVTGGISQDGRKQPRTGRKEAV
ncbi:hypothetical protein N0V90_007555 [Kalmusia sp. IMI 367209]|nr:hypothetical protein N0V90_007555 [Kalmusia sp. IMI 367209]